MKSSSSILGIDVGGASLKGAIIDADGQPRWAGARRFPLWKHPERLADELQTLVARQAFDGVALTMTGELCDAFETKSIGVQHIIEQTKLAFPSAPLFVWQVTGRFAHDLESLIDPWQSAASNWLALAEYVAGLFPDRSFLLVDVGSTTTDVIPVRDGIVIARGRTDPDRLATRELLYRGVRRTPVTSLLHEARIDGMTYSLMAELFATTLDAYLVLGKIPSQPDDHDTADGRAETIPFAIDRLARMIGSDRTRFVLTHAQELATQIEAEHLRQTVNAIEQVVATADLPSDFSIIASGEGEWLTAEIARTSFSSNTLISLAEKFTPMYSRAACACAVACLAQHRL
jgi:(4-(4-[2-(gamma-L-glutamylamino)ethyl]phenoxymethyl)furan-2-yl)methanamine synthase